MQRGPHFYYSLAVAQTIRRCTLDGTQCVNLRSTANRDLPWVVAPPRRASPRAGGHPRGRKKNKRENQKRGPNLTGPGPARAAFSPVHVVRPVQDVAYGPVLLLLVERGRSV